MAILDASLDELRATRTSIKWRFYPPDVVPVWVAEMDCVPCEPVRRAVHDALDRGDTGYAAPGPLEEAFAGFARDRWGWEVDPRAASMLPDVMIGVGELLRANTRPDGAVILSPPCYDSFFGFVQTIGRRLVAARLNEDQRLDFEALERAFQEAPTGSAYLLCNPQNPTGTVHTTEELATLARLADRYDVFVVSDEIHGPLALPGRHYTPYLKVPDAGRGVAVVSGSKAWNLAGLKIALAVPGADAAPSVGALHEVNTHGANHLAEIAHTAAYTDGRPWLDQLTAEIEQRRDLVRELLAEQLPEVRVTPAEATYLVWLDCSQLGLPDPAGTFLQRGKVALGVGRNYDPDRGRQWVRFNAATSPGVIREAVCRMARALA